MLDGLALVMNVYQFGSYEEKKTTGLLYRCARNCYRIIIDT